MQDISTVMKKYVESVDSIDQIAEVGFDVAELCLGFLNALRKENEGTKGFEFYKMKLDRLIKQISEIKRHPVLVKKYGVIYNQAIVLLVSNLEAFSYNLAVTIIDNYHELITWPESKKVPFDVSILSYKFPTLGEVIIDSLKDINFQDLQSTIRFFEDYMKLKINLENKIKENIVLYHAIRHSIVHNSGNVDQQFLKQIRETRFAQHYLAGQAIHIDEKTYNDAKESFAVFANELRRVILEKMTENYGNEFVDVIERVEEKVAVKEQKISENDIPF